jgi:hypothetical protein
MVAHGARDAYSAWRTLGLQPGRHVHPVAMQVRAIGYHVTDVDPNAKSDGPIGRLIGIVFGHVLLHLDRAADGPVEAIEPNEQRVASGLDDPPAVLVDRWVDQPAAKGPQPFERS